MQPMTKKDFWAQYWFSPLQLVKLTNPKKQDYVFMVELRQFVIRSGATEELPGTVANVYLSEMTRVLAQDDDKLEHLSDFALMKIYYDRLIVSVKDLAASVDNTPSYLKDVPEHVQAETNETPPWLQNQQASALPQVADNSPVAPESPAKPEAGEKSFELNGLNFKAVTDDDGNTTFFKEDIVISEADYAKAASLV